MNGTYLEPMPVRRLDVPFFALPLVQLPLVSPNQVQIHYILLIVTKHRSVRVDEIANYLI